MEIRYMEKFPNVDEFTLTQRGLSILSPHLTSCNFSYIRKNLKLN